MMKHLSKTQVDNIRKRELLKIGEFIKRRRTRQNVTQNDVAEVLSVNRAEISYYESGSRDMPISSFFVLGEALGFKLKDYVLDIESRASASGKKRATCRVSWASDEMSMGMPISCAIFTMFLDG